MDIKKLILLNSQDYADRNYYLNEIGGSKKFNLNFIPENAFDY